MPRFRKKPVEIEAMKFDGSHESAEAIVAWSSGAFRWERAPATPKWHLFIVTLEGDMKASPGDWVVRGVQGEFYPVKPDVFQQSYEPVEDVT